MSKGLIHLLLLFFFLTYFLLKGVAVGLVAGVLYINENKVSVRTKTKGKKRLIYRNIIHLFNIFFFLFYDFRELRREG